jgi:hypothetical protein
MVYNSSTAASAAAGATFASPHRAVGNRRTASVTGSSSVLKSHASPMAPKAANTPIQRLSTTA